MTKSKATLTMSLLVIALNTSVPNIAFAGGTADGTNTADSAAAMSGVADGRDQDNDWGWIGLLGLLGLLGLKGRNNDRNRV